jgi:hypothetical protein
MPDRITKLCRCLLCRQGFVHKPLMSPSNDIIPHLDQHVKSRLLIYARATPLIRSSAQVGTQCPRRPLLSRASGGTGGVFASQKGRIVQIGCPGRIFSSIPAIKSFSLSRQLPKGVTDSYCQIIEQMRVFGQDGKAPQASYPRPQRQVIL